MGHESCGERLVPPHRTALYRGLAELLRPGSRPHRPHRVGRLWTPRRTFRDGRAPFAAGVVEDHGVVPRMASYLDDAAQAPVPRRVGADLPTSSALPRRTRATRSAFVRLLACRPR